MDGFYSGSPLGLQMLLAEDTATQEFYSALPEDVQWQIREHQEEFRTPEELHRYAKRLLEKGK